MSGTLLQRWVVRLLHDPTLVRALHDGGPTHGLTAKERAMLLAVDVRAFGTDPYRQGRLLTALLQECPVAAALMSDGGRDQAVLLDFFRSAAFHDTVMARGLLVDAFAAWLDDGAGPVAAFEGAAARARRRIVPRGHGWTLPAGQAVLTVPEGTTARWQAVRAVLGADPVASLVQGIDLPDLPPLGQGVEHLHFVVGVDGNLGLSMLSEGVAGVLAAAELPLAEAALYRVLRDHGAEPGEEADILAGFIEDGELVAARGLVSARDLSVDRAR